MSKFRNYDNYEVFEDGRIYSYKYKKFLKPCQNKDGYQVVNLYNNEGKRKNYLLHRVIYETFSGSPIPEWMQINHLNETKTSNFYANLQLVSPKENCNFGTRNKRIGKSNSKSLKNNPNRSKAVGAYKNGELVMTFQSVNEAMRQGFNKSHISECCCNCYNREGNNVYKGFTWKYL